MSRRVGLWLIGGCGGVGSTAAIGLSLLAKGLTPSVGMVSALPLFADVDLDAPETFVVGGHDIRTARFVEAVRSLHERSGIFTSDQLRAAHDDLVAWGENIRPGTIIRAGSTISGMADRDSVAIVATAFEAIDRIQTDLTEFRDRHSLDQVVVINTASTEPEFAETDDHQSVQNLTAQLDREGESVLPASSLYAMAALEMGIPYVNFTPSVGASLPALDELARMRNVPYAGKDGKTGETLIKTVLAPMFVLRNLKVRSWVGHNILGAGDGRVLADPENKATKIRTKDAVLGSLLGYKAQSHVSIEYIESMDDWKTAWDHIHFEGFLGTKMMMQFTWQGCDSILAAPLVLDLARLTLLAQRRKESGVLRHLACFFKSPMGVEEHDFFIQNQMLVEYLMQAGARQ